MRPSCRIVSVAMSLALLACLDEAPDGSSCPHAGDASAGTQDAGVPEIVLVRIAEVKRWDGHGDEAGLCRPPNEIDDLFKRFCASRGYDEMRYGEPDGTCRGGIAQDFNLYRNLVCFKPTAGR